MAFSWVFGDLDDSFTSPYPSSKGELGSRFGKSVFLSGINPPGPLRQGGMGWRFDKKEIVLPLALCARTHYSGGGLG